MQDPPSSHSLEDLVEPTAFYDADCAHWFDPPGYFQLADARHWLVAVALLLQAGLDD